MNSANRQSNQLPVYELSGGDFEMVGAVTRILEAAMREPGVSWAQKASIAAMLHLLTRLPAVSSVEDMELQFTGARKRFSDAEIYFYLSVETQDDSLAIRFGGHFYRLSSGGDSFTVFRWSASPGDESELCDFTEVLGVLPSYVDPFQAFAKMPDDLRQYTLRVADNENSLLADVEEECEPDVGDVAEASETDADDEDNDNDEDVGCPVIVTPATQADQQFLRQLGLQSIQKKSAGGAYGAETCDGCRIDLSNVGLFVDGNSPRLGWGNYCAACCLKDGLQVGRGLGQLYAVQPDGRWLGVAGFDR